MATDFSKLTESPGPMLKHPHTGANYHPGEDIISHLNYALTPLGWDWASGEHGIDLEADEVWVLGTLTARMFVSTPEGDAWQTTVKTVRGWQAIGRKRDGSLLSIGDSFKGADTDALKRAARLLGVGLDAWSKDAPATNGAGQPQDRPTAPSRPRNQPAATEIPLAPREELLARYGELIGHAKAIGFRPSWIGQDTGKLTPAQIQKYSELAGNFIARNTTSEGAA